MQNNDQKPVVGAILIAGILIAGAILLKGSKAPELIKDSGIPITGSTLSPIGTNDRTLGNPQAKVALVLYEDFQCPFCGAINDSESSAALIQSLKQRDPNWTPFVPGIMNDYVKKGNARLVYRDWAFLGPESIRSAEAARCAGDHGKFWEYHDYLYNHQNGENQDNFSDPKLKSFAKVLNLDTLTFNKCFDGNKHEQAVIDSRNEGNNAGVTGTPKGFILKDGKIFDTIDGAESYVTVKQKIDNALK